jgi:pimeloyl-ACP methyl ester carboxylesterase
MLMSNDTHQTARTQFVQVGDARFAYRRFGQRGGLPLLFLNYFAANMDEWDPKVTNGFAAERDVILFDNAGVGTSSGETPSTVAAMTFGSARLLLMAALFMTGRHSEAVLMAESFRQQYPESPTNSFERLWLCRSASAVYRAQVYPLFESIQGIGAAF